MRVPSWTVLCVAFAVAGCGTPETKPETKPAADAGAKTESDLKAAEREKTAATLDRLRTLTEKVQALPDRTAGQLAAKDKLIRFIAAAKVETTRRDPLSNTLPENAMARIAQSLDQVEAEIRTFPAK
jgi:hypothetical protein